VPEVKLWRRCSACKNPIELGATYWTCNVSTCNRKRTALQFCSVTCWEVHLPGANHRESWAEEQQAPRTAEAPQAPASETASATTGTKRIVRDPPPASRTPDADIPKEILIVASRLKDYIRAKSGFKTSDRILEPLSEIVRRACDDAIRNAERAERMTVLDRDVKLD
jgi:hypothetical protein